jgi:hypothetical protein
LIADLLCSTAEWKRRALILLAEVAMVGCTHPDVAVDVVLR